MLLQVLLDLVAYGLGFLAALVVLRGTAPWLAACVAYPLGLFVVFLLSLSLALAGVGPSPWSLWPACAVALAVATLWALGRRWIDRTALAALASGALAYGAASAVSGWLVLAFLPNDSMWFILLGKVLAGSGDITLTSPFFTRWSAVLMVLNATARLAGGDYWYSLPPLVAVAALFNFVYFARRAATCLGLGSPLWPAAAVVVAAGLSLALVPLSVAVMVNVHLLFATCLLSFFALAWLAMAEDDGRLAGLAAVFLVATIPLRVEGLYFAPVLAVAWAVFLAEVRPADIRHALAVPLAGLAWTAFLALVPQAPPPANFDHLLGTATLLESRFLLPTGGALLLALGAIALLRHTAVRTLCANPSAVVLGTVLLLAALLSLLRPEVMAIDFYVLFFHLTHGRWGGVWMLVLPTSLLVLGGVGGAVRGRERFLACGVLLFVVLVFIAGFARKPFHTVYTDSADRMLLHVFPTGLLLLSVYGFSLAKRLIDARLFPLKSDMGSSPQPRN